MLKIIIYIKKITLFHIFYALTKIETLTLVWFFSSKLPQNLSVRKVRGDRKCDFQVMAEALYFFLSGKDNWFLIDQKCLLKEAETVQLKCALVSSFLFLCNRSCKVITKVTFICIVFKFKIKIICKVYRLKSWFYDIILVKW